MKKKQSSYGIIPLKRTATSAGWQVLLVKHKEGHYWALPKGHAEEGETFLQTAERELFEETGLTVKRFISQDPTELVEQYCFQWDGVLIEKTVTYFIAEVEGTIQLQEAEISECRWVPLDEAAQWVTYKEAKALCEKARVKIAKN